MSATVNIITGTLIKKRRDDQVVAFGNTINGGNGGEGLGSTANWLLNSFEIINTGTPDACLVCKLPLASWYEITAYASGGQPASLWDSLPYATAGSVGGIKVGSGLSITNGVLSVNGGAGVTDGNKGDITVSGGGSVWGINNAANWNTAYNHSQAAHQAVINGTGFVKASGTTITFDNNTYCLANDSRLTDARTPVSHTHGNITNAGYLGSTANIPLITGTSGIVQAGSFGTAVNTFCQGNDLRLSDYRNANDVYAWAKASVKPSYSATEVGLGNVTNESKATMFTSPTFTGTTTGGKVNLLTSAAGVTNLLNLYTTAGSNGSGTSILLGATINEGQGNARIIGTGYSGNNYGSQLQLQTTQVNGTWNTGIYLDTAGNVGIGTTSPATTLGVIGNTTLGGYLDLASTLYIRGNVRYQSDGTYLQIGGIYAGSAIRIGHNSGSWDRNLYFGTTDNSGTYSATFMSIINQTGNVLIGQTSGSEKLCVTGNVLATGEVTAYYSSDRRLKQDINYQWSGLDLIDKMRPATYHWNNVMKGLNSSKDDRINYGMIADEMANVTPDLIHTIYEKYQSVDYVQVIPILVKAIKELREEVNQLKRK